MLPLEQLDSELDSIQGAAAFCVACCSRRDTPLVYVSDSFCSMTGFERKEMLGRNCRFLQGRQTTRRSVADLRNALIEEREVNVSILNYSKAQTPFWNQLYLRPVRNGQHILQFYIGVSRHNGELSGSGPWSMPVAPVIASKEQQDVATAVSDVLHRLLKDAAPDHIPRQPSGPTYELPASLLGPLTRLRHPFVLTDPSRPDGPVVHASPLFLRLCGYPRDFVLGRNCRFMQGPHTDRSKVKEMRSALDDAAPRPFTVQLLNYRGDGTPFWNHLHIAPIRNHDGGLAHFVGIQLDVTDASAGKGLEPTSQPTASQPGQASDGASGDMQDKPLENGFHENGLPPAREVPENELRAQKSVVGAVRVVCRSLSGSGLGGGLRRPLQHQRRASVDVPLRRVSMEVDDLHTRRSSDGPTYRAWNKRLSRLAQPSAT